MHVPHDLATRLASLAGARGRSPEALLREALSVWMDKMAPIAEPTGLLGPLDVDAHLHRGFVPQPCAFSVYE